MVNGDCPKGWEGKSIIVKFSFTSKILTEILSIANDLPKMKAGDTTANRDTMEDIDTMKDHEKPKALELTDDDVQSRLSQYLKSKKKPYEDRVLQILVMTELFPITKLKTSNELVPVIKDIFKCEFAIAILLVAHLNGSLFSSFSGYRWLYEHAELIHRDISLNNLMYRKADGRICGVLIDYDLSLCFAKSKQGRSTKQRMGTRPYMAIDLLQRTPTKHLYRHDLESLFYVIVVLVTRYDGGKEIKNPPFQTWFELPPRSLREKKVTFLREIEARPTSAFKRLRSLLLRMGTMFHIGYDARRNHIISVRLMWMEQYPQTTSEDQAILDSKSRFNDETLAGNVDFDKFQTILNTVRLA
jgi:serine/threonine protein kinase